jgi:predicted secreted protein
MLRTGFLAAVVAALPFAALAGDQADREFIGFSPDGGIFAFEEYGVEDGSGFPYSNIYFVETDANKWMTGTPIRVRIEDDDSASLESARAQAREKAQALLDEQQIGPHFFLVASNPVTETSANPHEVRFIPRPMVGNSIEWSVALTEKELPAPDCPEGMGGPFQGFALTLTDPDGNDQTLHEDTRIPASRKCPLNYGISDIITAYPDGGEPLLVVIVNVFSLGFEGPNRRFIAASTRFPG